MIPAERRPGEPPIPAERCTHAYEQYLRQDRALSNATIINYVPFIRDFLKSRFGTRTVKLSSLRASDVTRFVQSRAGRLHVKRAKVMTTALRSYFRYARLRGKVEPRCLVVLVRFELGQSIGYRPGTSRVLRRLAAHWAEWGARQSWTASARHEA